MQTNYNSSSGIKPLRVIGIDPGSRATGYAVLESRSQTIIRIASGVISTKSDSALVDRLMTIHDGLTSVIREYLPTVASVEAVFHSVNPRSSLILGHARGAILVTLAASELKVFDYSAKQIKTAVVGHGNAEKQQVAHMVGLITNYKEKMLEDESDAAAAAICHIHSASTSAVLEASTRNPVKL